MNDKLLKKIYINEAFRHHQAGVTIGNFSTDHAFKYKYLLAEPVEKQIAELESIVNSQSENLKRLYADSIADRQKLKEAEEILFEFHETMSSGSSWTSVGGIKYEKTRIYQMIIKYLDKKQGV